MPLYEYKCTTCESQFELLMPMSKSDQAVTCPSCHNGAQRTVSTFASFSTVGAGDPMPMPSSGPT